VDGQFRHWAFDDGCDADEVCEDFGVVGAGLRCDAFCHEKAGHEHANNEDQCDDREATSARFGFALNIVRHMVSKANRTMSTKA
jgi:hypothetical protein